ncbi:hypothetical protein MLD52_10580 [Puniceicoccaceae bacterium K14]|nr:hypothetical protein [Puniceicoccaceae bacterium K14]
MLRFPSYAGLKGEYSTVPRAMTFEEQFDETLRILSDGERDAFLTVVRKTGLSPTEFLWACLDTVMESSDDAAVLSGCYEAAEKRFQGYVLPGWAREE